MKHFCRFCQNEATYVPLKIEHKSRGPGFSTGAPKVIPVYYCYDCQAEYAFFGSFLNVHIYTTIRDRMYRWSVEWNGAMGRLWYVGKPGIPGKVSNDDLQLVKDFNQTYPNITPQNIQKKLRFILLFL